LLNLSPEASSCMNVVDMRWMGYGGVVRPNK